MSIKEVRGAGPIGYAGGFLLSKKQVDMFIFTKWGGVLPFKERHPLLLKTYEEQV